MTNEFSYLENVIIRTDDRDFYQINEKIGTIIGLPDQTDKDRIYIIYFIQNKEDTWAVPAKYLITTGQFENEKNIYPD